jgi:signal transduction histidine kinase
VVTSLVSNAIKYGNGTPIEVTVEGEGAWARLCVRDHGVGIAANDRERIFRRFERADQSGAIAGMGLGLWMVKELVAALGGSVDVTSELGQGSTFTIELPRESADIAELRRAAAE